MIDLFGRVSVGARQWVRHTINLPDRKPPPTFSGAMYGELTE